MAHSNRHVQAARDDINMAAAVSHANRLLGGEVNKTAERAARGVERDERREARDGEQAVERP